MDYEISLIIHLCLGIVPIALIFYLRLQKQYILILLLLIFSLVFDLWSIYYSSTKYIWNIYNIFEFALLALINNKYTNSSRYKFLLIASTVAFSIQYICEFSWQNTMNQTLLLSISLYIVWSLFGSIHYLKSTQTYKSENSVYIYFNAAMLIYYSSSLIFFNILPYLTCQNSNIWIIHNVIESSSKLIITYAFWKLPSRLTP